VPARRGGLAAADLSVLLDLAAGGHGEAHMAGILFFDDDTRLLSLLW
jgi:hypothetical protein